MNSLQPGKEPLFLRLPFEKAVLYFRNKVPITSSYWKEFTSEQHKFAFTVAGLTKASLLQDAMELVDSAIADGASFDEFKKNFKQQIMDKGWNPSGTEKQTNARILNILSTNVRTAYSYGRHEQMNDPDIMKSRPYRIWKHGESVQPRPHHLALNGKVFDATDKFWDVVGGGACGFGCKCKVFSLSDRDIKRMGKAVETPPDPYTIAEPGFRSEANETARVGILNQGISRLNPVLQNIVKSDLESKETSR